MKYIYFFIVFISLIGCHSKSSDQEKYQLNDIFPSNNALKELVLLKGDTNAYNELNILYLDHSIQEEFLLYAMVMANKYNYPQAYFDVFTCLTDVYIADISKIDTTTANIAIEYLLAANQRQQHQARDIVDEYNIQNSQQAKEVVQRIFSTN